MRHAVIASIGTLIAVLIALACGLAGCSSKTGISGPHEDIEFPARGGRELDLLFLVDDSTSMDDKQANLAAAFETFVGQLSAIPGGLPSVHIGVVSPDLGTKGALDPAPGPVVPGTGGCRDNGKNAALQINGAPVTGAPYLSDLADATGARARNYTGTLTEAFGQIATGAGTTGCGFEQPLEAIKRALTSTNAANQGFLRDDAYLGVVIISDEDDCSIAHSTMLGPESPVLGPLQSFRCTRFGIQCDQGGASPGDMNQLGPKSGCHPSDGSGYLTSIADYTAFFDALKPDPSMLFVVGLVGPGAPVATELRAPRGGTMPLPALARSCTYMGPDRDGNGAPDIEVADPAIRIEAFVDHFGERGALSSICRDLAGGLSQLGDQIEIAIGDPCFAQPLADRDAKAEGVQPECTATAIAHAGQPGESRTELPRCSSDDGAATNAPCWRIAADPVRCIAGDHVAMVIDGAALLPAGARVEASCASLPR